MTNEQEDNDPAPTGSLSINDQLFEDYNEESDQDWASGGSESESEGSIDQSLLAHPAFHMDDDDVDVDGPEDESLYQHGKKANNKENLQKFIQFINILFIQLGQALQKRKKNSYKKK